MGDGLIREMHLPTKAQDTKHRWHRDRVYGGLTRDDLRYNLRRRRDHHLMVSVYTLHAPLDGTRNSLTFQGAYANIERALAKVATLDRELTEAEARAEYDRLMRWMEDYA